MIQQYSLLSVPECFFRYIFSIGGWLWGEGGGLILTYYRSENKRTSYCSFLWYCARLSEVKKRSRSTLNCYRNFFFFF